MNRRDAIRGVGAAATVGVVAEVGTAAFCYEHCSCLCEDCTEWCYQNCNGCNCCGDEPY